QPRLAELIGALPLLGPLGLGEEAAGRARVFQCGRRLRDQGIWSREEGAAVCARRIALRGECIRTHLECGDRLPEALGDIEDVVTKDDRADAVEPPPDGPRLDLCPLAHRIARLVQDDLTLAVDEVDRRRAVGRGYPVHPIVLITGADGLAGLPRA